MNQDNYSHILNIKIVSKSTTSLINDENLLETIKGLFLEREQYFNDIKLIWRRIEWKCINKYFDIGDIVIDSIFGVDEILLNCIRNCLQNISKELHDKGLLLNEQEIIFKIVKPLVNRIPLVGTIGII